MLKKSIIVIMMVFTVVCGGFTSNAAMTNETHSSIIGMEHIDDLLEIDEACKNGELEIEYIVHMSQFGDTYWMVVLEDQDEKEDKGSIGFYNHIPTEKELNILWENRTTLEELEKELNKFGF